MTLRGAERQRLREATACLVGDDARLAASADRVRAALRSVPPAEALQMWHHERLIVLAVHRAAGLGVEHASWTQASDAIRAVTTSRAGLDELILIQLTRALGAAGIRSVVLKGPPLAARLYGDRALRDTSRDADLLVPTADLFRAADVIVGLGWLEPTDPLLSNGLPLHHLVLMPSARVPAVELHWRVQWHDEDAHARGLLDRAIEQDGLPVLAPVDVLDLLLQSWARDGFHKLRLGADVAAWWRTYGDEHGAEVARIYDAPATGRAASIGASVSARLFGTPPPPAPPSDRAARVVRAVAHADWTRRAHGRHLTQRALVEPLVANPGHRREQVELTLFLAPEISQMAHPWAPPPLVPLLRLGSAARTAIGALPILVRSARFGRPGPPRF